MKEQLDQAIQKALEKVFEKWNKEKLLDCFPSIKQKSPDALERAHDAIKDYVLTNVMRDYEQLNTDKNLSELLDRLEDELRMKAAGSDQIGEGIEASSAFDPATEPNPKPRPADDLRRAVMVPRKREKLKELERQLGEEMIKINSTNSELADLMKEYSKCQSNVDSISRLGVSGDQLRELLATGVPEEELQSLVSSSAANIR